MRLVTVATFDNRPEAHVARMELEAAGIQAVVTDETVVSQLWHIGALNGMKLQVAEENEARARTAIASNVEIMIRFGVAKVKASIEHFLCTETFSFHGG